MLCPCTTTVIPPHDQLDPEYYLGTCDCGTVMQQDDGGYLVYNVTIQCLAHPGTGKVTMANLDFCPFRDHANVTLEWLFQEQDAFLRDSIQGRITSANRNQHDISFYVEPLIVNLHGYHMKATFCLAAAAMATGWKVDDKVRRVDMIDWLIGMMFRGVSHL